MKKRISNLLADAWIIFLAALTSYAIIYAGRVVKSPMSPYMACLNAFIYGGIFTLLKIRRMPQFVRVDIKPDQAAKLREMISGAGMRSGSLVYIGMDGKAYPYRHPVHPGRTDMGQKESFVSQNNTFTSKNSSCCGKAGAGSACHDHCGGNEALADRLQHINYDQFKKEVNADPTCSPSGPCEPFPCLGKGEITITEADDKTDAELNEHFRNVLFDTASPAPSSPGPSDRGAAATEYRKEDEQIPLHYLGAAYADSGKSVYFPKSEVVREPSGVLRKATPEEIAGQEKKDQ